MRRSTSVSFSVLVGMGLLFFILIIVAVILSNQVVLSFLQDQPKPLLPLEFIGLVFIAILLGFLCVQIVHLYRAWKKNEPGIRFKLRLVAFFGGIVFLSGFPSAVLTANLLRTSFDVWFVKDTNQALKFGLESTLSLYQLQFEGLKRFWSSDVVPSLVRSALRNPETGWRRILDLQPGLSALQVFDEDRLISQQRSTASLSSFGDSEAFLLVEDLQGLTLAQVVKQTKLGQNYLRFMITIEEGSDQAKRLVASVKLGLGFDQQANLLSQTESRLAKYSQLGPSFPLIVFSAYIFFFIPLILLALMMSVYVAEMLIAPLAQLERAVWRVGKGDYGTRLLVRKNDVMATFIMAFNDMTGELERSRRRLMQTERLQTWQDIAQRLAHEIKNPLTPIKLSAERILRKYRQAGPDFAGVLEESVGIIIQEVEGLSHMLSEFRDFARLPAPNPELIDLRELIGETWALFASDTSVAFDDSGLAQGLTLRVDRGQFQQVFKNLFRNALDAVNAKAGALSVNSYEIDKTGRRMVRIHVKDNGTGIPEEKLEAIFNPYYTSKKDGTGLGLAITEKIILDHGGRIWAESKVGQGSSFFIDIYLHQEEDDANKVKQNEQH